MNNFEEDKLIGRLNDLSLDRRVAFALGCAQRLVPFFGYPDELPIPDALQRGIDQLRDTVLNRPEALAHLEPTALEKTESLDLDDNAVAATIYCCRAARSETPREAAWAARRAYEAHDRLVEDLLSVDINDPSSEELVLSHPIVQSELKQQERDIEALGSDSPTAMGELLEVALSIAARGRPYD